MGSRKRFILVFGVLVFGILLSVFGSAGDIFSDVNEFLIRGCNNNGNPILAENCSSDKTLYCDSSSELLDTLTTTACSDYLNSCCPNEYYCDVDGTKKCEKRQEDCETYVKLGCKNYGCYWNGSVCMEPSLIKSCSDYLDQGRCDGDSLMLGQSGIGSEICKKEYFLENGLMVRFDSCHCEWKGGKCVLTHAVINKTMSFDSSDLFSCSRDFILGDCVDGNQDLTWIASITDLGAVSSGLGKDILNELGCLSDKKKIACGEAVSNLPGFGFVNIILIFGLLGIFYIKFFKRTIK